MPDLSLGGCPDPGSRAGDDLCGLAAGERRVPLEGVLNFRDLGGYPTRSGGRTRWRHLYRSGALYLMTSRDLVLFAQLGVQAVYDLRSDIERAEKPNPVASVALPLEENVPREEFSDGSWLVDANAAETRLRDVYLAILTTAGPRFGQLFEAFARPGGLPAVFHCAAGKDRTGLATALLLSWLEVDREVVLDDYNMTGQFSTLERDDEVRARFISLGMSLEAAKAFMSAPRWVMAEALAFVDEEYGGVASYLSGPAGMSQAPLMELRRRLVEQ